jgi:hypothetical protein
MRHIHQEPHAVVEAMVLEEPADHEAHWKPGYVEIKLHEAIAANAETGAVESAKGEAAGNAQHQHIGAAVMMTVMDQNLKAVAPAADIHILPDRSVPPVADIAERTAAFGLSRFQPQPRVTGMDPFLVLELEAHRFHRGEARPVRDAGQLV